MTLRRTLDELFRLDAEADRLEAELLSGSEPAELSRALAQAADEELGRGGEGAEARIGRLAGLLGSLETFEAARGLVRLLDAEPAGLREAAGEGLVALGSRRFDLLRSAVAERALGPGARPGPALAEVAYVVAEVDDPAALDLLLELLRADQAAVVGSAIEVAGEHGLDPRVRRALEALSGDPRLVTLEDEAEGEATVALGELAEGVLEALRGIDREGA